MKLPVIKHLTQFIEENDQDYIIETIEVLEALTEVPSLKDEELDVIGELISNMYGALEVNKMIKDGTDKRKRSISLCSGFLAPLTNKSFLPYKICSLYGGFFLFITSVFS